MKLFEIFDNIKHPPTMEWMGDYLRSKEEVNKEEEDKDDEAEKGLVGEHRRPEGNKAAGDHLVGLHEDADKPGLDDEEHLKVTKQGGHPCDDQEKK